MFSSSAPQALAFLALVALTSTQTFDPSQFATSPSVLPSPATVGAGGWSDALQQAQAFVSDLTLEEKAYLVTGINGPCVGNISPIPRKNFTGLCLMDGPLAIRQADFASVFPAGLSTAASWNKGLMQTRGMFMGEEFKGKGANIALGPVAGPLGRSALAGRNWEGFSPDPYLTAKAFSLTIQGMQSVGAQSCAKHFIGNEQETQRNPSVVNGTTIQSVSSNIDDRTMHELYLWPFAEAVKAGVSAVMCSYNRVNSTYSCQNSKILNGLLKGELGFQGYVMSDWEGTHSGLASITSGLDMNMPGGLGFGSASLNSFFGANITDAVNNGSLPMSRLDDMCQRVLTPFFFLQQQEGYPNVDPSGIPLNSISPESTWSTQFPPYTFSTNVSADVRGNHATLIRTLAGEAAVLLKNTNNTLPLKAPKNIGVFGNDAADLSDGLYSGGIASDIPGAGGYDIGVLAVGGGSGTGRLSYVVSPLEAIKARAQQDGALVQYISDNTPLAKGSNSVFPPPEVCLVFLKTWVTEGFDRTSFESDFNGDTVVTKVAATCPNTVVITHAGGINTMPWASNPNVTAIIAAHFGGQEVGNGIVDVLYGAVNPSGHLPYTIANNASDYNAPIVNITTSDPNGWQSDFTEGLLIDYRHFDSAGIEVQYEFGFGLSYTTFNLSDMSITKVLDDVTAFPPPATTVPGGNPTLWDVVVQVSATVSNTGSVAGAAVPQLYLSLPSSAPAGTPVRTLKGFEKVSLDAGQSATVNFDLLRRDLSFWNIMAQDWEIPSGQMGINVGFSSRDLRLSGQVAVM